MRVAETDARIDARLFDIWSLAGLADLGLVSGRKNSGPGADCLETGNLMRTSQASRIGGSIPRGNRARSLLQRQVQSPVRVEQANISRTIAP